MDYDDSRSLLKTILGIFARKPPEKPAPASSLRSQALDAWVRTDAYLQHETNDFEGNDPEQLARTLTTLEDLVQYDCDPFQDLQTYQHGVSYPKLQLMRRRMQNPGSNPGSEFRIIKRKRENDAAIEELARLDVEAKRRRVLPRGEPNAIDIKDLQDADSTILTRRHSLSLHQGLRTQWSCVCHKCTSLSVGLSLPQQMTGSAGETCFEVFFGVRSVPDATMQEAKITVKDVKNDQVMSTTRLIPGVLPEIAQICPCITESLDQHNCLHLLYEDGLFKRLRPQPKNFGDTPPFRTISLSALFKRQQELSGGSSVLPLKGKRILAVTLATALLPFLETPWVRPSFNHSRIQFYQPLKNEELPDITKPFLEMEHAPINSCNIKRGNDENETDIYKQMVHPNASVLALGILLLELHYCKSIQSWQSETDTPRNMNTDYYTSLDLLKTLEDDAGVNYFLATKACLQWEYFPAGEPTDFESATVQRLFYQNVIKRLECEIETQWEIRLEDLKSLNSQEKNLCWGQDGRKVVHQRTRRLDVSASHEAMPNSLISTTGTSSRSYKMPMHCQIPSQHIRNPNSLPHIGQPMARGLYFFDASQQVVSGQDAALSDRWMNNLLSLIYHYVDPFDAVETGPRRFEPVRIAILDSGFDPHNPFIIGDNKGLDPRIKAVQNFVDGTESWDIQDEIGHGTHALGLLLKFATCAEIYIARIANKDTLGPNSYDSIAQAINHAVTKWNVDIISMSFGIREYHELMNTAISNALHKRILLFAAASNDGGNFGRAFPAKYPGVFCIYSTDGNGNPSAFNPTADEADVNFSLLGENVCSYWPAGTKGHGDIMNVMSGTSVATPIAAGLAASILSLVRQQEQGLARGSDLLGPWLKDVQAMDAVLKSMVRQRRGVGYDYITPHLLLDANSSREHVYNKIKDIKRHMYD